MSERHDSDAIREGLPPRPEPVSHEFWSLVDLARDDREAYRARLRQLDETELVRWYWTFDRLAGWLRDSPYVEHMDPGLMGDDVDDVAQWVVAQGRDAYFDVIDHPDHVPKEVARRATTLGDITVEYDRRFGTPVPFEAPAR
jgi:hypothetical protein